MRKNCISAQQWVFCTVQKSQQPLPNLDLQFQRRHPHPFRLAITTVSHIALKVNEWKLDFSIAGADFNFGVGVGVGVDQGRNCFSSLNFCCWFMAECRRANVAKQARM